MQRKTTPDKVVKELQDDRERASNLSQALRLSKAMNVVVEAAKIEEVEAKSKPKRIKMSYPAGKILQGVLLFVEC